jgi:hypothetical protein
MARVSERPNVMEPTADQALVRAHHELNEARAAAASGDARRQGEYARAAIDSATTSMVDPAATQREIVAAHFFLSEALALDGRGNTCGAELIDIEHEASALADDDRLWLQNIVRSAGNTIHDGRQRRHLSRRRTPLGRRRRAGL